MVADKTDVVQTGTVAVPDEIPDDVARELLSWEDAQAYFKQEGIEVSTGLEISDGFILSENKNILNDQPFLIVDWKFYDGEFGDAVTFRVITPDGRRFRFNDGSTGVKDQLVELTQKRVDAGNQNPTKGAAVRKGFRESEYWIDKKSGHALSRGDLATIPEDQRAKASTFYLQF